MIEVLKHLFCKILMLFQTDVGVSRAPKFSVSTSRAIHGMSLSYKLSLLRKV